MSEEGFRKGVVERPGRATGLAALLVALVGIGLSLALFYQRSLTERRALEADFASRADRVNLAIEHEVDRFLSTLDSLSRLHRISESVNQAAFGEFVDKGLVYHQRILGVFGWAPRVEAGVREAFEAAMQRAGYPGYEVVEASPGEERWVPAGERAVYFPISFVQPPGLGSLPPGLDLGAHPANRQALTELSDDHVQRVGRWFGTDGGPRLRSGVMVFSPIYEARPVSLQVRGAPRGVVWAVLKPSVLLDRAVASPVPLEVAMTVTARKDGEELVLYNKEGEGEMPEGLRLVRTLEVAGWAWRVQCRPMPALMEAHRTRMPELLLAGGLAATAILVAYLFSLAGRAARIERLVQERTAAWREANRALHDSMDARRQLEQEVLELSAREKGRIGRDLHDSLGQKLTGAAFISRSVTRALQKGESEQAELSRKVTETLWEATDDVRRIARGLSPVDLGEEGLVDACRRLAEETREVFEVACDFEGAVGAPIRDPLVAEHVYQMGREAVLNAVRHSGGGRILISLSTDDARGRLTVEDDGSGLPDGEALSEGVGFRSIRYRSDLIGARVTWTAAAAGGVRFQCEFPLSHGAGTPRTGGEEPA